MDQFEFDLGLPPELPSDEPNPLAQYLGYGPEGAKCKKCRHLYKKSVPSGKHFYKCGRQMKKNEFGKDWRVSWNACRLYEEGE